MTKTFLAGLLVLGTGFAPRAQTLFTYGNKPVAKADFLRVYQKNALNRAPDLSEKALRDYLDLYSLFRMKVDEAGAQHLDTATALRRELETYRRQLSRNYLADPSTTERLMAEAYDRMKTELQVAHILLPFGPQGDTAGPARQADSIYQALVRKKASFPELVEKYSADKVSREREGVVGYITGLQTVYAFENAAYNTPVGGYSKPFRTQFGYHIVKVLNRRPAQGTVEVAQIMAVSPKSRGAAGLAAARRTIDSAVADMKNGLSWADAVQKYSQDRYRLDQEGRLKPFGAGRTTPAFENAAFALKKPGDISAPVETEFGVHLIRLIARTPLQPFDTVKDELRRRIETDTRGEVARTNYLNQIKQKFGWKEHPANYEALLAAFRKNVSDTGKDAYRFYARDYTAFTAPVLTLNGVNYSGADLMHAAMQTTGGRMMGTPEQVMRNLFDTYSNSVLEDFQLQNLEKENAEFRNLMQEYRDGILLFDLMERNVWSRAAKDSAGLEQFYQSHADRYRWDAGFEGVVYRFTSKGAAERAQKLLRSGMDTLAQAAMFQALNTPGTPPQASVQQQGRFEWNRFTDFARADFDSQGITGLKVNPDGSVLVAVKRQEFPAGQPKSLPDARGLVVADYQDYLEKSWNEQLRKKYPVKVDEKVFRSMVK